jgi:hypothetical protein
MNPNTQTAQGRLEDKSSVKEQVVIFHTKIQIRNQSY